MAAELYPVLHVKRGTARMKGENETVELVIHNRATYAPTLQSTDKLQRVVHPMTVRELTPSKYPTNEQLHTHDFNSAVPLLHTNDFRRVARSK